MSDADFEMVDRIARERFKKYEEEASLVVTSRLHAAAPCLAMGIPVIMAANNIDYRFSWLDKYVPIYTPEEFEDINWNPDPIDIEDIKEQIFEIFREQIQNAYQSRKKLYDLSAFYENRKKSRYNAVLADKLEKIKITGQNFRYIICGAGVHGKLAFQMMTEKYPMAECLCFVDKYMEGKICGKEIIKIDALHADMFDFALITSYPGKYEYSDKMKSLGKTEWEGYIYFMSKNEDDK